jgi:HD-like signal output (HDOD) protein
VAISQNFIFIFLKILPQNFENKSETGAKMDKNTVFEKLKTISALSTGENVYPEIIRLIYDPTKSIGNFEKIVKRDPALMVNILKVVNSPAYGIRQTVSNIRQAMVLIGTDELYRILMKTAFYINYQKIFDRVKSDFPVFWKHFEVTAVASQILAEEFSPDLISEAYLVGLIHDSGKLVIAQFFPHEWKKLIEEYKAHLSNASEIEKKILGSDHGDIAGSLFKLWNFGDNVTTAIKYHHRPLEAPSFVELAVLLHVADFYATKYFSNPHLSVIVQETETEDTMWQMVTQKYPYFNFLENQELNNTLDTKIKSRIRNLAA